MLFTLSRCADARGDKLAGSPTQGGWHCHGRRRLGIPGPMVLALALGVVLDLGVVLALGVILPLLLIQ